MSSSTHPSVDIKFDFVPFNGTPGETYDKWERALLNAGARADDRGYSISDHLNGVDERRHCWKSPSFRMVDELGNVAHATAKDVGVPEAFRSST